MLLFGVIQIVVSQIPDFHNMAWLSVIAAVMSFTYSFIGLGLGFAQVIGKASILLYQFCRPPITQMNLLPLKPLE